MSVFSHPAPPRPVPGELPADRGLCPIGPSTKCQVSAYVCYSRPKPRMNSEKGLNPKP